MKLLIAFTLFFAIASHAATDPSVMQARNWDTAIAFGPGAYRGSKGVKSEASLTHTIEPGAFLESVTVDGTRNALWNVDGAYLKECRFSGDLGTKLSFKNTALESCNLHKSGGWFVGWAGTRWKFDNCLITRSFMPKSIGLHDYAVHVKDSTFVGVELPVLGLKDDPSKYAGKDDNAFIRCRFIGCEIPESVLAMSVDCVFENCKFNLKFEADPKKKDRWVSAENPVSVKAYIIGSSIPAPHNHGKLSVAFLPATPALAVGCKLPYTQAGGRIIVPWSKQLTKFNPVGSVDKKSSEIPVFTTADITKPTPPSPIIPAPPKPVALLDPVPMPTPGGIAGPNSFLNIPIPDRKPQPAPTPSPIATPIAPPAPVVPVAKELRNIEELLTAVPIGIKIVSGGKVNPAALEEANRLLDGRAAGKAALFRIVVDEIVGHREVDGG